MYNSNKMYNLNKRKAVVIVAVIGLIAGLIGGVIGAPFLAQPGPEGPQGATGATGPEGPQGATGATGAKGDTGDTGATGLEGATGATGADGADGVDGADGAVWWNGTGTPGSSLGVDGDFYLDLDNGDVYNKISGLWTWVANIQGEQGPQGIQGEPGLDGQDAIEQIIANQNYTEVLINDNYNLTTWYNMSVFDSSMTMTFNINDQSKILAEFFTSVEVGNSEIWFRIVIDNQYNSTVSYAASIPSMKLPVQLKILTGSLSAGDHTIEVQFYRELGSSILLDRLLIVSELPS
jgi:hypothetical protein